MSTVRITQAETDTLARVVTGEAATTAGDISLCWDKPLEFLGAAKLISRAAAIVEQAYEGSLLASGDSLMVLQRALDYEAGDIRSNAADISHGDLTLVLRDARVLRSVIERVEDAILAEVAS